MTDDIGLAQVDVNHTLLPARPAISLLELQALVQGGPERSVSVVMSPSTSVLRRVAAGWAGRVLPADLQGRRRLGLELRRQVREHGISGRMMVLCTVPPESLNVIHTADGSSELGDYIAELGLEDVPWRFFYATPASIDRDRAVAKLKDWLDAGEGWQSVRLLTESSRRLFFGIEDLQLVEQHRLSDTTRLTLKRRLESVRATAARAILVLLAGSAKVMADAGKGTEVCALVLALAADFADARIKPTIAAILSGLRPGALGWNEDFNADHAGWNGLDLSWRTLVVLQRDPLLAEGPLHALFWALLSPKAALSHLSGVRLEANPRLAPALALIRDKERFLRSIRNGLEHNRTPELGTYDLAAAVTAAAEVWCAEVEAALAAVPASHLVSLAELAPAPLLPLDLEGAAKIVKAVEREALLSWQKGQLSAAESQLQAKKTGTLPPPEKLLVRVPARPSEGAGNSFAQLIDVLPQVNSSARRDAVLQALETTEGAALPLALGAVPLLTVASKG